MQKIIACLLLILLVRPIYAQKSLLSNLDIITAENAPELQQVGFVGRGTANALDWHPDGTILAVASMSGVWLLDETLQLIRSTPIQQPIIDLAWSPDGSHIAVVSNLRGRCTFQIWDANFIKAQLRLDTCGERSEWNVTGDYLAIFNSYSENNEVYLIDTRTNDIKIVPGQDGTWSPSGDYLFTRLRVSRFYWEDPAMYTWDAITGELISELDITDQQAGWIFWGIDDQNVAISCNESESDTDDITINICRFNVHTGERDMIQHVMTYRLGQAVSLLNKPAWSDNQLKLAWITERFLEGFLKNVLVMDVETNEVTNVGIGTAFDWIPATDYLSAIVGNGDIRIYDMMGNILAESHVFTAPVNMIAVRPGSTHVASAGFGYEQDTHVWDIQQSWINPHLTLFTEPAEIVDYTPDGNHLIAGGTMVTDIVVNQGIHAFDSDTGKRVRTIQAFYDQGASPPDVYWNSDYTEVAERRDNQLELSNGITIQVRDSFEYAAWSPDGVYIATVNYFPDDYSFVVDTWNVLTGKAVNSFSSGMFAFEGLVWSSDSTKIAVLLEHPTGSNIYLRGLRVFTVTEGENYEFDRYDYQVFAEVNIYDSSQQVKAAWNSDGTVLAVALYDMLQIHDLKNEEGNPLVSLPAYDVVSLEWSPDDCFIVTGGKDGIIRLFASPS
ncbi:WD40 repeat domain-containing protein [Phototrophicus methaneseepsis]|uniref:WD40 repeat domain-containing protein n=1 Tax=Phototrophicus methaneseepsis TaxID=2710758 RepID=A0A7S8ECZ4_9CHLR|nr:WD40 repeat domain-containing protein [Phototrophicus methaneseepsis]QPC84685.1 WD40 repeat domain-containing protein [Phototrophicus methaneseepsis]